MAKEILTREDDRELLELAAKAAGYARVDFLSYEDDGLVNVYATNGRQAAWNPLKDDGDALRLAVSISVSIDPRAADGRFGTCCIGQNEHPVIMECGTDKFAATRRAIVRAAAEIGRTK